MKADRIIVDAVVLDPGPGSIGEALAIEGDRVAYVGSKDGAMALRGSRTRVDSLPGTTVLPGFCDSHLHLVGIGLSMLQTDLRAEAGVTSLKRLVSALCDRAASTPPGAWVIGSGFDDLRLAEGRNPTAADLDRATAGHPVLVRRSCGHLAVVNTRAMEICRIGPDTPDPPGGRIERDERGQPTGVLRETATALVDGGQLYGPGDYARAVILARDALLAHGITSAHTMDSSWTRVIGELQDLEVCPRLYLTVSVSSVEELLESPHFEREGGHIPESDHLRPGPVKIMLDGSDDSGSALMHDPYPGRPDLGTGMAVMDLEVAQEVVSLAHARGHQVAIHAIGDRAVDDAAAMIGRAMDASPRHDPRHRIEHCSFMTRRSLDDVKRLGLVTAVQPPFIPMMGRAYRDLLGSDLMSRGYLFATLLRLARAVPGGSDAPVADMCPIRGITAAVGRRQGDGSVSLPAERVSLMDALRMYTVHGAVASFDERRTGGLAPGMMADLAVINTTLDPSATDLRARVVGTMVRGRWAHRDPGGFPG